MRLKCCKIGAKKQAPFRGRRAVPGILALLAVLRHSARMEIMLASLADAVSAPRSLQAEVGTSLSRALWLSGLLPVQAMCSGLGRCGRCRVRFCDAADCPPFLPEEEEILGSEAVEKGWRLACRRQVPDVPSLRLEVPVPFASAPPSPAPGKSSRAVAAALGVDLGTTSVYYRAVRQEDGSLLAEGHFLNPQAGAGADIMSRLAAARQAGMAEKLACLAREAVRRGLAATFAAGGRVDALCVAGNTAMTDILLGRSVEGLCAAPYRLDYGGHDTARLPDMPPMYIPPLMAPFVGGDVSAGLAALMAAGTPRPLVLADLGTNGEFALLDGEDRLYLVSVPLGPALEGIGPECGLQAAPESITEFRLSPQGLVGSSSLARTPAAHFEGISATGYLSLLSLLRQTGLMDAEGHFTPQAVSMPLARRLAAGLTRRHGHPCLQLPYGLRLTAQDVEELLKVKAAFSLALHSLLEAASLRPADLACLCLAGALGEHVPVEHLERLGFVPQGLGARIRAVGNASLDGAVLLARCPEQREALARCCAGAHVIPLAEAPDFHQQYVRHMRFGVE